MSALSIGAEGQAAPRRKPSHGWLRIFAFFALVGVLGMLLNLAIDRTLRSLDTGEFGVWNRIVQGRINADVIVSGSSRALTHYDARLLGQELGRSVYNIGLNGSQTDMQIARARTYLRHNRAPRLLVHNLDAFSFQLTHGEVYDPGQFVPYLAEPELYAALARVDANLWKSRWIPLYGYVVDDLRFSWVHGIAAWLGYERTETHFDGFMPRDRGWTQEFEAFRSRNAQGVTIPVEAEGVHELKAFLSDCAARGIRVALVYSPEYRPMQEMTLNRSQIFEQFRALAASHGARFIDFSGSELSARQELFYNSQHLNARGAELFSRALGLELARWIREEPLPPAAR